jgi:hypothetical protein
VDSAASALADLVSFPAILLAARVYPDAYAWRLSIHPEHAVDVKDLRQLRPQEAICLGDVNYFHFPVTIQKHFPRLWFLSGEP